MHVRNTITRTNFYSAYNTSVKAAGLLFSSIKNAHCYLNHHNVRSYIIHVSPQSARSRYLVISHKFILMLQSVVLQSRYVTDFAASYKQINSNKPYLFYFERDVVLNHICRTNFILNTNSFNWLQSGYCTGCITTSHRKHNQILFREYFAYMINRRGAGILGSGRSWRINWIPRRKYREIVSLRSTAPRILINKTRFV